MHHCLRLFVCCILLSCGFAYAQDIPEPMFPLRFVNDFTGTLTTQENSLLENKLQDYQDSTSTQLYVVIVSSFNGYDKAQFAIELGEKWGIGQAGKDNGAVMLVKPKAGNEKGEIFIATGYGLEESLPDAICRRIIEGDIIPYFKENDYYTGIDLGTDSMIAHLSGEFDVDSEGFTWLEIAVYGFCFLIFGGFLTIWFILFVKAIKGGSKKGRSKGKRKSSWSSSSSSSGSSWSSGSSSSGGGGGHFGGGGAGGSW